MTTTDQERLVVHPRPPSPAGGRQVSTVQAATTHVHRLIQTTLRRWGLGQVAGTVADDTSSLINDVVTSATRGYGPIDLRLELHKSVRLLLAEIRDASCGPAELGPDERGPRVAAVAVVYGQRPSPTGVTKWYTHSFTW
jgi:hypothetical protein